LSGWGDAGGGDGDDRFYIAVLHAYVYFKVRNRYHGMPNSCVEYSISTLQKRQRSEGYDAPMLLSTESQIRAVNRIHYHLSGMDAKVCLAIVLVPQFCVQLPFSKQFRHPVHRSKKVH
jgi:hypothetical protein